MAGRHVARPTGPVFVDPSGRRSLAVRRAGWALTALLCGYLLLVLAALVGPPGLSGVRVPGLGPVLPGPGAARIDGGQSVRELPQAVLEPPAPGPSATRSPGASPAATAPPATTAQTPAAAQPPLASLGPVATRTPGPPTAQPGRTATPKAEPSPRRAGRASPKPEKTAAPGQTRRPSRSPR